MTLRTILQAVSAIALAATVQTASAQWLYLSGTSYTQDFNNLESGILPDGWQLRTNATATSLGDLYGWGQVNYTASGNFWTNTSGRFANQAAVDGFIGNEDRTVQEVATDRVLAIRQTGSLGDPGAAFVLKLENTTGFGSFSMEVDFQMLDPEPRETVWTVDYGIGGTPVLFAPVIRYTNNATSFGSSRVSISLGGALDNQSEAVWIRIAALDKSTGSGGRDTFGIDNFTLNYSPFTGVTPITITTHPQSTTNGVGTTATLNVSATGTSPTYQWRKGGADLFDDGFHIFGATSPSLQIVGLQPSDAGSYTVVVANSAGSKVSNPAVLTVQDPTIASGPSPAEKTIMPGDAINLFATVRGSEPITFQWRKNNVDIPGATTYTATGTNFTSTYIAAAQTSDAGDYSLFVSSPNGSAQSPTSKVSVLSVPANRIARWDFNDNTLLNEIPASIGSGTASLVGSTVGNSFSGSFSDPTSLNFGFNYAWSSDKYPIQGTSNKTSGVQFSVSTVGQKDIFVAFEKRHSATASKYARFQYSIDGVNFEDGPTLTHEVTDTSFVTYTVDLSNVPGVNNNPKFAYRILAEWESTATGSGADGYVGSGGSYGPNGTIRYDLMTVYGNTFTGVEPISLNIQRSGASVTLTWGNPAFQLQSADSPTGAWTTVTGATSGYSVPANGTKFYRLIAQ